MELAVIDASVAAKWVLTEPQTGIALDLLHGTLRCAAPAIIKVEVTGAVVRRLRTGKMSPSDARAACDDWRDLVSDAFVRLIATDELYDSALDLAFEMKHPFADCLYLAAAKQLDCQLVTADQALFDRGLKVYDRISLLAKAA